MAQELKSYSVVASSETQNYLDGEIHLAFEAYDANEVDAVLAEKDAAIAELKAKMESAQASWYADVVDAGMENCRLKRALWLARAERYKMREFIAREEGKLSDQISWSQYLRERTYNQWVDQLLRIANLANKLQNKCRAKTEEYK